MHEGDPVREGGVFVKHTQVRTDVHQTVATGLFHHAVGRNIGQGARNVGPGNASIAGFPHFLARLVARTRYPHPVGVVVGKGNARNGLGAAHAPGNQGPRGPAIYGAVELVVDGRCEHILIRRRLCQDVDVVGSVQGPRSGCESGSTVG